MERQSIEAGAKIEAAAPQRRTIESMLEDMRNTPAPAQQTKRQSKAKHLPTTLPGDEYADMKARLHAERPRDEKPFDVQVNAQALAPVILVGPNIPGGTNVDGTQPPNPHGAIGLDHFVEVTEAHIDIFARDDPSLRTSIFLGIFFGDASRFFYEPRVVYDSVANRWIVTAHQSTYPALYFMAVSTTSNALGPYYIYSFDITFDPGDWFAFPQLGMDRDAIIITADVYSPTGAPRGAEMFAVAKERLYNGLGFSVPVFTGLRGTLAPPIVLDRNPKTFLIAASPVSGNSLSLYTLTDSRQPSLTRLSVPVNIRVAPYSAPPDAPQPGGLPLPTLDGRFVNASTQVGDFLWQVHTINYLGYATPKFYQINTATRTVVRTALFYGTSTSHDFNASIAANSANDIFVTWSMTDPVRGTNVQVRYSGFDHNNGPAYELGPGAAAYTSPTWHKFSDWGGYSAVTIDPRNPRRAWLVNEDVQANHVWGTRIVGIGFAT